MIDPANLNLAQTIDQLLTPDASWLKYGDEAYNTFWVSPESTGTNWYTIAVPYLRLYKAARNTNNVGGAITGWRQFNPVKRFYSNDTQYSFTTAEIALADNIIIPFTNTSIVEFAELAKEINPKLHLIYHVDFDFTRLPAGHIYEAAFDHDGINTCIENIVACDKVIVTTANMATRIIEIMRESGHEFDRSKVDVQLLMFDPQLQLGSVPAIDNDDSSTESAVDNGSDSVHVVVICGDHQLHDLKHVIKDLVKVKKTAGKAVKFTIFGTNKNRKGFDKIVAGLEYRPVGAVRLVNYWAKLKQLNPDLILIPTDFSEFSQASTDYKRYLDAATISCAVLAPKYPVFEIIIKDGENGYLYDNANANGNGTGDGSDKGQDSELVKKLILAVSEKEKLKIAGKQAHDYAVANFAATPERLQRLMNVWG